MCFRRSISLVFIIFILCIDLVFPQTYTDQECLDCHGKPTLFQIMRDGRGRSLFVNPEEWSQDVHLKINMTCVDCHINANPFMHFREGFIDVDCARCHPEEAEEYQKNIHFDYGKPISRDKELPQCYHCHTKHFILRHDDLFSSVHEKNIAETCGTCHAEVMVEGILEGASLGKISGHRKGDLGERFDMNMCLNCHYTDSAHGAKRVYKDFCSRCHNVRLKAGSVMGPTHLNSKKWDMPNYIGGGLIVFLIVGMCIFVGYRSRQDISNGVKNWYENLKIRNEEASGEEKKDLDELDKDDNKITQ